MRPATGRPSETQLAQCPWNLRVSGTQVPPCMCYSPPPQEEQDTLRTTRSVALPMDCTRAQGRA